MESTELRARIDARLERIPGIGVWLGLAFLGLSVVWFLTTNVAVGVVIGVQMFLDGDTGGPSPSAAELTEYMPVWAMGGLTVLFLGGMLAAALILAAISGRPLAKAFAPRRARAAALVVGGVGGLSVGLFPGWLADHLVEWFPAIDLGALELIAEAISAGGWFDKTVMLVTVCVEAPVLEELIFRGYLWDTLERSLPRWATWLATSLVFAAYHVDPVQSTAVLFTGLFLGWLRLTTRSVWPSMLCHFSNNLLASVAVLASNDPEADPTTIPWWAAALAATFTIGLGAAVWTTRDRDA